MTRRTLHVLVAIVVATTLIAGGVIWQRTTNHPAETHVESEQAAAYYCPMHPTVTSDKPGNCPICGMKLVKRAASQHAVAATELAHSAKLELSAEQRTLANVKTVQVAMTPSSSEIVTTGRVTFDERRVSQVTSYTAGRIEHPSVNFTGDVVTRGSAVATIYSPDLYSTQQ